MRLASILLVSALFTCGIIISAAAEGKHAHGNRLLRSNDYDAVDEDRVNFAELMRLDDEFTAIKQLATEFANMNKMNKEALNVYKLLKKDMTKKQATYVANLYGKYLENPSLYH